jgi:hypothetical protein
MWFLIPALVGSGVLLVVTGKRRKDARHPDGNPPGPSSVQPGRSRRNWADIAKGEHELDPDLAIADPHRADPLGGGYLPLSSRVVEMETEARAGRPT